MICWGPVSTPGFSRSSKVVEGFSLQSYSSWLIYSLVICEPTAVPAQKGL